MELELPTRTPVTGFFGQTAFRYANYDTPFWARNNRSSGRWHMVGDGATQYLSLDPDAAWADLVRAENLRAAADLDLVRMKIWAVTLTQENIVDYSTFELAEAAGFPPDALVDDDRSRCQAEGHRLREEGHAGVISPSAALPGALNITLFGRRVRARWGVPTKLASAIPCCIVAVGGPPPDLVDRVRYEGDLHAGYEEYVALKAQREREARFADPERPGVPVRRPPDINAPEDQASATPEDLD
ncbi:MAG TPA: RES family NAD+ phosphorylase [Gaiellaceae bacterium]|nr:RES family NAD+ phosphorylase [Gaiellaceae bacterium]